MSQRSISDRGHWTSFLVAASGALVLGYVGYQYGSMYLSQHRLARQWQRQQAQSAMHGALQRTGDSLMHLSSSAIALDAIVVEGSDSQSLFGGPGHVERTPLPGERGNAVITAHRDTFFRHIGELAPGDVLKVERGDRTYLYQVTGTRIVESNDLSVIQPTRDAELTLITCDPTYYVGRAPRRLVVFSRLLTVSGGDELQAGDRHPASSKSVLKKSSGVR